MAEARRDLVALAASISAAVVMAAGGLVAVLVEFGPLSLLMAEHLFVMNVLAPLAAAFGRDRWPAFPQGALWFAGGAQLLLLYAWHLPSLQRAAAASPILHIAFLLALAAAALAFWSLVLSAAAQGRWRAMAALLLTGKLACLLGALLVFAPRDLYGLDGIALAFCASGPSTMADQHLAGLLMITACPLSYLVAGVILSAHMLTRVAASEDKGFALAPR